MEKTQVKDNSIKSGEADPRSKSVIGINVKTGEKKDLPSRSAWDKFFGKGRGTAAQAVSGKPKTHKVGNTDWKLYNVGEEPQAPVEEVAKTAIKKSSKKVSSHHSHRAPRCRKAVEAYVVAANGKELLYATYPTLSAAADALNVSHSSISKHLDNHPSYTTVGGCYKFKVAEA